ncbi:hypothetical protein POTOM_016973 [Populus tomentosa]|uniref:Uncharacterized protein n=1 Tax=Populus tomentosa TaxID=118781 RepID=A0A8X8D661_POPTO|nr:hypothetical protein POTOM_016973 [Populus tomentosa]
MAGRRNGERQKKKDLEKGSWKEDLEHFVISFCNEFRIYHFGDGQNCSRHDMIEGTFLRICIVIRRF